MPRTTVRRRFWGEVSFESRLFQSIGVLLTCSATLGCYGAPRRSAHVPRIVVNQAGVESRLAMMGWARSSAPSASSQRREAPSEGSTESCDGVCQDSAGSANVDVR